MTGAASDRSLPMKPERQRSAAFRRAAALTRLESRELSRLLRDDALVLVLAAALVGATTGVLASAMVSISVALHRWLYGLGTGMRLSAMADLPAMRALLVLACGGLLVGTMGWLWSKRPHDIVDPIEANALHGGRMSLSDSLFVAIQSLLSSSSGLSLGIEGGFTQIAGAVGSWLGRAMKRRRIDVRMLVGAGAAGGIAGAFDAPIAGAAYAFELILGTYSVATLAPVVAAAVAGTLAANMLVGHSSRIPLEAWQLGPDGSIWLAIVIGVTCGLIAIALMRGVTATEQVARASGIPMPLRPISGAIVVGLMALAVPHVLGSGHGAMSLVLQAGWPVWLLAVVLVCKIAASALSIGSGFRGGLFSTSLFLGTLSGALIGEGVVAAGLLPASDIGTMSLVGMASFGTAVVGAPMTMALLAVEITENLSVTGPVLVGVVAATLTVRHAFGYSFATWRFHLRGEAILGGEDIGWARETTARDLMRRDVTVVPATMTVGDFRRRFTSGTVKYAVATGEDRGFAGIVDLGLIYAELQPRPQRPAEPSRLVSFLVHTDACVDADLTIDRLLPVFDERETEVLVVVASEQQKTVLGLITEAFALKRYRLELEARQKEIFGS